MSINKENLGLSVIEVIVAVAIFVIIAASSVTAILGSFLSSRQGGENSQALGLAKEGLAAVESIRNQNFSLLANGPHGLSNTAGAWSLAGANETIGKFTRVVDISDVKRDLQNNIASSGLLDPDTKKVTSTVTWNFVPTKTTTVELTAYLTNWQVSTNIPLGPSSCTTYCEAASYNSGTCRGTPGQCNQNGETNLTGGNQYCTGGPTADTCCCKN